MHDIELQKTYLLLLTMYLVSFSPFKSYILFCSIHIISSLDSQSKFLRREDCLVRDFNFIIDYKVSQSVLRCTQTDTLINKLSYLSALVQYSYIPELVLGFY